MPPSDLLTTNMKERVNGLGQDGLDVVFSLTGADRITDEKEADRFFFENIGRVVINWRNAGPEVRSEIASSLITRLRGKVISKIVLDDYIRLITRVCNVLWQLTRDINIVNAGNFEPTEEDVQRYVEILATAPNGTTFAAIKAKFPGLEGEVEQEH